MIWAMAALVIILMALIAWGDLKLMLGFLAVVLVAGVALLFYDNWADFKSAELISPQQVELKSFTIKQLSGAVYELRGRVINNADGHHLKKIEFGIRALDCSDESGVECVTIGEIHEWLHTDIPAGQARDVKEKILFQDGRPQARGELRWEFEVISTQAN